MRGCRETDALISRHVDGELSAALQEALRDHLRTCGVCGARARREQQRAEVLRAALAVPETDLRRLRERLVRLSGPGPAARGKADIGELDVREARVVPPSWPRRGRRLLAVAAGVLIGVGVWIASPWYRGGSDPSGRLVDGPARPEPVLWLSTDAEDVRVVPGLDGPPVEVRVRKSRTILSDIVPEVEGKKAPREIILELERTQNRFVGDDGSWH